MSEHRTVSAVTLLAFGAVFLTTIPATVSAYTIASRSEEATFQQAMMTEQQVASNVATNTSSTISQYVDAVQGIANVSAFATASADDQLTLMQTLRATGVAYFETFNPDGSGRVRSDAGSLDSLDLATMSDIQQTRGDVFIMNSHVAFIAPLQDNDNQIVGYVSAELDSSTFLTLLTQLSVSDTTNTNVWIMQSNSHRVLLGNGSPPDVWQDSRGVVKTNYTDGLHIVAYDTMQRRPWTAVIDHYAQNIQTTIDIAHVQTAVIVILIAIVSTVSSIFIARIITKPLMDLVHASELFAPEEPDTPVPDSFISEVHRLNITFDGMRKRLRRRSQSRERALLIAQHAATMREQFMAVAAHELKTPLTSLQGNVQLAILRLSNGDQSQHGEALRRIETQVKRLSNLVDSLMDASRIERGTLALARTEVNLPDLIEEVVQSQWPTPGRISFKRPDKPVIITGDSVRIGQVISNIVSNAVKYSPDSTPIEVSISELPKVVRIGVRDHGTGVPVEIRDKMFEQFVQGHSRSYQSGLGLGLFISKQIVELHGGTIGADFPDSGGTLITVTLPKQDD